VREIPASFLFFGLEMWPVVVHIDLQRLLNYLLLLLAIGGGLVTGMLAGRVVDLSLGGGAVLLPETTIQQSRVRQLQEEDFQVILNRNLFDSQAAGGQVEQVDLSLATIPGKEQPVAKAAGDMTLIGTVVAGKDSLALIQVGRKVSVFRLGAEVAAGVEILAITRNKVTLRDGGGTRELVLKQDLNNQSTAKQVRQARPSNASGTAEDGILPLGGNRWQISRSAADNARSNFNSLLSTARMVPQIENDQTIGFRLLEMKKGTLLEKIGLQVGDVLVEINDVVLDSPEKALQVFQQVREANNISLGLIRNGERQTFEYSFE